MPYFNDIKEQIEKNYDDIWIVKVAINNPPLGYDSIEDLVPPSFYRVVAAGIKGGVPWMIEIKASDIEKLDKKVKEYWPGRGELVGKHLVDYDCVENITAKKLNKEQ